MPGEHLDLKLITEYLNKGITVKELINKLKEAGFNRSKLLLEAYDKGDYRVFIEESGFLVTKFNRNDYDVMYVEWSSILPQNIGTEKTMKIIEAMTED